MELISVKALSEELGISKPTLFKRIDKLGLRSDLQKQGKALMIPEEVADKLRASFRANQKEAEKPIPPAEESGELTGALIELLKAELKSKEERIKYLEKEVSELQEDNRRYMAMSTQLLLSSGSSANESQSEPIEAEIVTNEEEELREVAREHQEKKSFFRRLFNL